MMKTSHNQGERVRVVCVGALYATKHGFILQTLVFPLVAI